MAGVSFSPAASPIPAPRQREGTARSASTSTAMNTLIWPYFRLVRSGSSQIAAAENASATSTARERLTMKPEGSRSTRYDATGTATTVADVTSTRPATAGSTASGANTIAANGG
jgi:hypothetical protein